MTVGHLAEWDLTKTRRKEWLGPSYIKSLATVAENELSALMLQWQTGFPIFKVINCCNSLADYLPCGGLSFQPTFIQFPIFRGRTAIRFVFPRFIATPGAGIGNGCHIVRRQWKANGTKALHSQAGI
ncbi:uncharacterized protein CIMG_13362 [Coccidioides immitis RS]|uniref:Uncharacterized protein n=1 Tax=Coccidioides immitis (strain RS) TaxID=246410 RepID=A0A0E1RY54_COCIM|nr:uncharacterized protein CIMG_13362 [Coccidioides immitis RS]EAS33423.2 hypothetical protein CIMG_13362 [Coccidioides immitis RS]